MFKFNLLESVSESIDRLGHLNLTHLYFVVCFSKFLKCTSCSLNTVLLSVYKLDVHSTECINLLSTLDKSLDAILFAF
jgi:hypothetical protein